MASVAMMKATRSELSMLRMLTGSTSTQARYWKKSLPV